MTPPSDASLETARAPVSGDVRAVLGPTNTGKTYLAMERMRAHATGMIGFPLRLLARENYDRLVELEGRAHVALITGEEKIVPPRPRWWICTVEAMPLGQPVEFLAVDEIQLCADPERGHVFTDRLLHARGREETMFLGAESMQGAIRALVPEARIETRPRLSTLSWAGTSKLSRLPRRSAVVAFSVDQVYRLAEMVRRQRGGAAVVLGALSPRTRNAQVQMYQAGEVDYLIATDAIGMGLNMDVDHVTFAGLAKFDGMRRRPLSAPEMGQIAGRAGRHMNDGTFGVADAVRPPDEEAIRRIVEHDYPPIGKLCWRNRSLDFASPGRLMQALNRPPSRPELVRARDADDQLALAALTRDEAVAARAGSRDRVQLLWEVCQIPDFRKVMPEHHAQLLGQIFTHLVDRDGRLPEDWVRAQIERLDRTEGDIDTLTARLAHVRTWTFVAHRADWMADSAHWQGRARQIEDALSDALHDRLTDRFVDRRAAVLSRGREAGGEMLSAVTAKGDVVVEGHVVGRIEGLSFHPHEAADLREAKALAAAAHRALREDAGPRVARLVGADDSAFGMEADGRITWIGRPIARVAKGAERLRPRVRLLPNDLNDRTLEERVQARLQGFLDRFLARRLGALIAADDAATETALTADDAPARGLLYRLRETMGAVPEREARAQVKALSPAGRKALTAAGVRFGTEWIFLNGALAPKAMRAKAILWAAWTGGAAPETPTAPSPVLAADALPEDAAGALGYERRGPLLLRLDRLERVSAELRQRARKAPVARDAALIAAIGLDSAGSEAAAQADGVLRAFGFRRRPSAEGEAAPEGPLFDPPNRLRRAGAGGGPHAGDEKKPDGTPRDSRDRKRGSRGKPKAKTSGPKRPPARGGAPGRAEGGRQDGGRQDGGRQDGRRAPDPNSPFAVLKQLVRPQAPAQPSAPPRKRTPDAAADDPESPEDAGAADFSGGRG
ncbi:MAG: helicase-related protein [Alphaproteobacteria bacterium]|nr:helicase-related protein [Alphaproteobacteria bacterium]